MIPVVGGVVRAWLTSFIHCSGVETLPRPGSPDHSNVLAPRVLVYFRQPPLIQNHTEGVKKEKVTVFKRHGGAEVWHDIEPFIAHKKRPAGDSGEQWLVLVQIGSLSETLKDDQESVPDSSRMRAVRLDKIAERAKPVLRPDQMCYTNFSHSV